VLNDEGPFGSRPAASRCGPAGPQPLGCIDDAAGSAVGASDATNAASAVEAVDIVERAGLAEAGDTERGRQAWLAKATVRRDLDPRPSNP
jgi:hypothetical protein